jgi:hypothetical protein
LNGVTSTGSRNTFQQFQGALIYSVQIPSENIGISREVLLQGSDDETAFQYALTDCLAAMSLHSLFTTQQLTLNNVSSSSNTSDILARLLRMSDGKDLTRYHMYTPSLVDCQYGVYSDDVGTSNNPPSGFANSPLDFDILPRGCHPVNIQGFHFNRCQ